MSGRFGIVIGRASVATIKRRLIACGEPTAAGFSLTLRDQDGYRVGQFELSKEIAADLVRQLTGGALRAQVTDDLHDPLGGA